MASLALALVASEVVWIMTLVVVWLYSAILPLW